MKYCKFFESKIEENERTTKTIPPQDTNSSHDLDPSRSYDMTTFLFCSTEAIDLWEVFSTSYNPHIVSNSQNLRTIASFCIFSFVFSRVPLVVSNVSKRDVPVFDVFECVFVSDMSDCFNWYFLQHSKTPRTDA